MKRFKVFSAAGLLGALAFAGCNGNGNGSDGGQHPCGSLTCTSGQACINDTVCVPHATDPANAAEEEEDVFHVLGPADLSCHNAEPCSADTDCPQDHSGTQLRCKQGFCAIASPEGPETVTFRGCVDAFGIGDTTHQMRVALYRGNQDPTGSTQWDQATFEDKTDCEYWGAFEFENVPTNTPLILKTYDEHDTFVVAYKYNLILWADLAKDEGGGNFVFDTRDTASDPRTGLDIPLYPWRAFAISQTTYNVILLAVGITNLPENSGGVAGTVRDCHYHEMQHVRCGFVDKPGIVTYFTNAASPAPDDSIHATNVNGIYAAIDLPAGDHVMACLARDQEGNQVMLGEFPVKIFPHGITLISLDWYPGVD
jgi:hypothetical protein